MTAGKSQKLVVAGAGNVGLPVILMLAIISKQDNMPIGQITVLDFDRVEAKDVNKGYHRTMLGMYKAEAAAQLVKEIYGKGVASNFQPLVAAAQSTPGLFRQADAVFNGTDSNLDAAQISEEARNSWEVRMSTGISGWRPLHTIEVMPEGFTLGEHSYDPAAWADASRQECQFGLPINSFKGVVQPFGSLTAAHAVQAFLCREKRDVGLPYFIRISGKEMTQCYAPEGEKGFLRKSRQIKISYDRSLEDLWNEVAIGMNIAPEDLALEFPIPIVRRWCTTEIKDHVYQGFERQPVQGLCPICRFKNKTYCVSSIREVLLDDVLHISDRSLRDLNTPAGLRVNARTRDGRWDFFHLPYQIDDVPGLVETI